ncbi:MAG: hypothetical protein K2X82_14610 [Gemmataceae bacterium]|nr:hypothetical protein [Gemmataceae bacterium]
MKVIEAAIGNDGLVFPHEHPRFDGPPRRALIVILDEEAPDPPWVRNRGHVDGLSQAELQKRYRELAAQGLDTRTPDWASGLNDYLR